MAGLVYRHWSDALDPDRCLSVDGGAPGRLHISHWPGNRTPDRFRHVLSTGGCLMLAQAADRAELLQGIDTVTNNHWDTDGLCSVYACLYPEAALRDAPLLADAASAGDYQVFATPEALKLELTLTALTRHPDSPVHSSLFTDDLERRQAQYDFGLELLPRLIEDPDTHLAWIEEEFRQIQSDMRLIREEDVAVDLPTGLELAILTVDRPLHPVAVQTVLGCDRVLVLDEDGRAELRLSTRSWFDRDDRVPRPDWVPLIESLSKLGEVTADDASLPTPVLSVSGADPRAVRTAIVSFYAGS